MLSSRAEQAGPAFPDRATQPRGQEAAGPAATAMLDRGSHMQLRILCLARRLFSFSSDFNEQEAVRVSQTEVIG